MQICGGFCCRRRRGCLSSLLTAWTTSMLNCWPTKNLSTINRSWDYFPDRKFDSNFIHAAENAAFLFFLSSSLEHSLTSVENLRQNPAIRSWKFAFCSSLSMWCAKRSLPENNFTRGLPATCGRISASTWAASWTENIQVVSSSISLLFKLSFCFFFFFRCFLSITSPVDRGWPSFFLFFDPDGPEMELASIIFIRAFFWTATWRGTFFIGIHTTTVRVFLPTFRHFVFLFASGDIMTSVKWSPRMWLVAEFKFSREIQAKNRSVCEKAVTEMWGSFTLQVIGSWCFVIYPIQKIAACFSKKVFLLYKLYNYHYIHQ